MKASKALGAFEVKNVYKAKQLAAATKGFRSDLGAVAALKLKKLQRGATVANGIGKGAKTARNRKGQEAVFTFGKLETYRNHVRATA